MAAKMNDFMQFYYYYYFNKKDYVELNPISNEFNQHCMVSFGGADSLTGTTEKQHFSFQFLII